MRSMVLALLFLFLFSSVCTAGVMDITNLISMKPDPMSPAHDFDCWHQTENQIVTYTLYVHEPVNYDFDNGQERPVTNVNGFECRLVFTEGMLVLGWHFPVPAINVGEGNDLIVGFSEPVPVVNGRAVLATFDVFFGNTSFELPEYDTGPCYLHANAWVYIFPRFVQSIPGFTAYLDADDPVNPLVAGVTAGEEYDFRFLIKQEEPVSTEGRSWGALKALYR